MSVPATSTESHHSPLVLPALFLLSLFAIGSTVVAQDCEIQQITFGLDDLSLPGPPPSSSADGRKTAFVSNFNLVGLNPNLYGQVYLHDMASGTVQITQSSGRWNGWVTISGNGDRVVFGSEDDLTGGNPDGNTEVFLYEVGSGQLSQITSTTNWFHSYLGLDDSGDALVMLSTSDPIGGNADHSIEVFVLDLATMIFTQITDTTNGQMWDPKISGDGSAIAFRSSSDLDPGVNLDGNKELFLYRRNQPIVQITDTTSGINDEADLDWSGQRLVFTSDNDLVPSSNPDLNIEVFLWDQGIGFTQLTNTSGWAPTYTPSIDDAGRLVTFVSGHDLVPGQNPFELDHLFAWEAPTGEFTQITFGNDQPNVFPDVSGSGISIVFYSYGELVPGGNPTGDFQIFSRVCGLFRDNFVTRDLRRWSTGTTVPRRPYSPAIGLSYRSKE